MSQGKNSHVFMVLHRNHWGMLENFQFLKSLTPGQLEVVAQSCEIRKYNPGEFLIREGEYTDELYFILSGAVALYKQEPTTRQDIEVKAIGPRESFGEMSFLGGTPRSGSVKAVGDVSAYVLNKRALFDNSTEANEIIQRMAQMLTHSLGENLRALDNRYSTIMYERIEALEARQRFSYFFVVLILMLFSSALFSLVFERFFAGYDLYSRSVNWLFLIIAILIPLLLFFNKIQLSASDIGVTLKNWKPSLRDGLLFSGLGWIVLAILSWQLNPEAPIASLTAGLSELISWTYLVHSALQEFVRATIQVSIQRFFENSNESYALILTGILFANVHSHFGIEAVLVVLVVNIIFGLIYSRTYNLIGVTMVHFLLGWMAFNMGLL